MYVRARVSARQCVGLRLRLRLQLHLHLCVDELGELGERMNWVNWMMGQPSSDN